ncbi:outer membrane beta-barrel protein [Allomuricauda sp. d1]|uniref:outer membrane beta-barrel protein n=1 Tax=Allomuricauda sp. d1 TaxID=3136725 RepID=UPI0031D11D2B
MGKKDIEELFKERFKDFQQQPDDGVWQSIEASLDKKKQKKRIAPIWWQLGGVAALLAVLLYVVNPFDTPSAQEDAATTTVEQNSEEAKDLDQNPKTSEQTQVADSNDKARKDGHDASEIVEKDRNQSRLKTPSQQETEIAVVNKRTPSEKAASNNKETQSDKATNSPFNLRDNEREVVASAEKQDRPDVENAAENQTPQPEHTISDKEKAVADNNNDQKDKNLLEKSISVDEVAVATADSTEVESNKKSIYDAIEEQQDNEENALAESKANKWSVGPSVAPVYFSSLGEGSPIHSNFAANSKSGNVNLSYGLTVAYDLGKRLTVRSGIHRVDFGYDTDDIIFSSSLATSTNGEIDNIDYNQASRNLVVQSKTQSAAFAPNEEAVDLIARTPEFEGRMVQQMGYLEVPVELNYALVDKKFGVNLIGGVSSLFLIDNSVSLESDGLVTEMGEANNVNDVNFSTNVGVGFNYEFSPKIQVNLEPVFKYQLNTFSDTAGDFRPFSVGVYSGVSFKF